MHTIEQLLHKPHWDKNDLAKLLAAGRTDAKKIFQRAYAVKKATLGNWVYFRGLIEFSNICGKDCLYCGIRGSNRQVARYNLPDEAILQAAEFSWRKGFGSVVLQSGECDHAKFHARITKLLREIHRRTQHELGVTISLGEQPPEVYKQWREAGAHRYLLRIEATNQALYEKIHPQTANHSYHGRLQALRDLQNTDYQTGTGVMIGLPFQSVEDLAADLMFFKAFDVDMVGMGPYVEHKHTPLYAYKDTLMPQEERFFLTLKMIALLRILMPDINIAAATALQAIDPLGREKAIQVGANVVMPNVTPTENRANYSLYENKPCTEESGDDCVECLDARIHLADHEVAYGKKGHPLHYFNRVRGEG